MKFCRRLQFVGLYNAVAYTLLQAICTDELRPGGLGLALNLGFFLGFCMVFITRASLFVLGLF